MKETGIIENDDKACSSFYPKHFASDEHLKLMPGVTIDKELEIQIDTRKDKEQRQSLIN